jgi:hypothetical protein
VIQNLKQDEMNEASVKEVERDSHVFIPGAFEALD